MKKIKMMLVAVLVIPCAVLLAACGGPNIPAWVNDIPATTDAEIKTYLEGQGFTVNMQGATMVGTKAADGKFYNVTAMKSTNAELKIQFDAMKKSYEETGKINAQQADDVTYTVTFGDYCFAATASYEHEGQSVTIESYMTVKGDWMISGGISSQDLSKM